MFPLCFCFESFQLELTLILANSAAALEHRRHNKKYLDKEKIETPTNHSLKSHIVESKKAMRYWSFYCRRGFSMSS